MIISLIKIYYSKNLDSFKGFENKNFFSSKINISNDDFFTYLKKFNKFEDLIILELIVKYVINRKKSLNKIVINKKNYDKR